METRNSGFAAELYRAALPAVRKDPLDSLPRGLFRYVWRVSRRQQIRLCLMTCLVFPLSMVPLELQRRMIDDAVAKGDLRLLLILGGIYLGVVLLHGALKYLRNVYLGRVAEGVTRLLRRRMLCESHGADGATLEEGARVSMVTAESERLGGFVGESLAFPLLQAGIVLSVLGYMFVVEPVIALITLCLFLPSVIVTPLIQRAVNRLAERRTLAQRELGDVVVEEEGEREGDPTATDSRQERAESLLDRLYRLRVAMHNLKSLLKFLNNLIGQLGPLSVLLVGGWFVIQGETQVGVIVAFISGYERLTSPLRELVNYYRRQSQMRVQYRLVAEVSGELGEPSRAR